VFNLKKIFEYLKRSLLISWKTVFFNFKQYVCFFIALIIIQTLYGMMAVSSFNNNNVELKHVHEEYDYHVVVKGLNENQYVYLFNSQNELFKSSRIYQILRTEEYSNSITGEKRYDAYLIYLKEPTQCHSTFMDKYVSELNSFENLFSVATTPLVTFSNNEQVNNFTFAVITIVLLFVSIFLLSSLYNIRVNQYKFQYGIYLTYGADFKMLFGTAFWELFVIFIVTFIPSVLLSTLCSFLIYRVSGYGFVFNSIAIIEMFVFTLIVLLASVWAPMKIMSVKDPNELLITEDNSNFVSSPRSSVNIFAEKFPMKYEFYSLWRFRKYNFKLLTTAIVFCALFIMGLYLADIYTTDLYYPRAQFEVGLRDTGFKYNEKMSDELYAIEGVTAVKSIDNSTEAATITSHMLVENKNVRLFKDVIRYNGTDFNTGDKTYKVSNSVVYTALNPEQILTLDGYDITGDPSCIKDPGYVIVGDAISNIPTYKFNIGDKIQLAVLVDYVSEITGDLTGEALLRSQISNFKYEYIELTIGAIVHDIPCDSTPVFMNETVYEQLTGAIPSYTDFSIYIDNDLNAEETKALYAKLRAWGQKYGDINIHNNNIVFLNEIAEDKHYDDLYIIISLLILCISPVIWFFSQTLYYAKRGQEFTILISIGAIMKEIKKLFIQGGLCMATLSLIISIALSYLGSYAMFYVYNVIVPFFTGENVRYTFYMPWYAIVTSIIVSVACGFFSTYIPYLSYAKKRRAKQNIALDGEFGDEE